MLAELRTFCGLCGLTADWDSAIPGPCEPSSGGGKPLHSRPRVPAAAGRRKGAARPCGMGLRPTLPPVRCSRIEAGYGERPGVCGWASGHRRQLTRQPLDQPPRSLPLALHPPETPASPFPGRQGGLSAALPARFPPGAPVQAAKVFKPGTDDFRTNTGQPFSQVRHGIPETGGYRR